MTLADLTEPTTQAASSIGVFPMLVATGIVACGAVLVVWLLRTIRPAALRVPGEHRGTPVERWARGGHSEAARAPLERLIHDTENVTRLAAEALDERMRQLEVLIALADERLAELDKRMAAHAEEQASRTPEVRIRPIETPRDSVMEEIYRLADEGRTPVEIARQLEEHAGKVELILALRTSRLGQRPPTSARPAGSAASA